MNAQNNFKILVIDDEDRIRMACRRVLERDGFTVCEAADGEEGLAAIDRERPDLVLVDLMMPKLSGMEVLAEARKHHPDLAFVVITGFATLEKAVESMKQGADDFLAKPFKPGELRMVVDRALKRVKTLQDMAIEKSRNRLIVESSHNGVLVVDAEGKIALMNPSLQRMVGWDQEQDPRGRELAKVLPCPEVVQAIEELLAAEQPPDEPITCQVALPGADGELYLQVTCRPFLDSRGEAIGALAIFNDISAWRRLDQLKSEYVSTVAHDIASPLGSVVSQLQTLESGLAGELNPKQLHLIQRARMRVQGIIDLSRDLLDLAKMESGTLGEPQPVQVADLLKDALEVYQPQAEQKNQTLELELEPELPPVMAVPRALGQVFNNLVSNAVRYTPEGGRIVVRARRAGDFLEVAVEDNGLGIPPEDQERIFQRFYRVKNADTRHIVGTGLGLPIVKRVVDDMGGEILLESEPGKGSTFIVRLPLNKG